MPNRFPVTHDAATNRPLPIKLRGRTKPRILLAVVAEAMGLFLRRAE